MKLMMAGAVLLGFAAAVAACGGSDSKANTTPAASAAASTKATGTAPSATQAATKASAPPAATASSAPADASGGDTCKYLSASEAAALLPSPGAAKVTSTESAATKQTTCSWGSGTTNRIIVVVNDVKISSAIAAIKSKLDSDLVEKIDGLGDAGGFETKSADAVSVAFVKGSMQVLVSVSATGVSADAVAAAAKKIAAGL